jgi:hypothetical protein
MAIFANSNSYSPPSLFITSSLPAVQANGEAVRRAGSGRSSRNHAPAGVSHGPRVMWTAVTAPPETVDDWLPWSSYGLA